MTELLHVEGLTKHFPVRRGIRRSVVGTVQAVTEVDLTVAAGETLAVVGESGCGKSTLGRAILRLHEPTSGAIRLEGDDITALDAAALRWARRRMQIIFQDPFGSLNPRMTVRETLSEPLLLHGLATPANVRAKVDELVVMCGLSAWHADRYPHEFSGGQRQRIALARALVVTPQLLVLDEPTSALDVTIQKQVLGLLQQLQRRRGLSYLLITHDVDVVRAMAHDVMVLKDGQVVEAGPVARVLEQPAHVYTQQLLAAA